MYTRLAPRCGLLREDRTASQSRVCSPAGRRSRQGSDQSRDCGGCHISSVARPRLRVRRHSRLGHGIVGECHSRPRLSMATVVFHPVTLADRHKQGLYRDAAPRPMVSGSPPERLAFRCRHILQAIHGSSFNLRNGLQRVQPFPGRRGEVIDRTRDVLGLCLWERCL
jgi:hypothetical protein